MYEIFMYARQHFFMIILSNLLLPNSISDYNVIVTFLNKKLLSGVGRRYIKKSIRQYSYKSQRFLYTFVYKMIFEISIFLPRQILRRDKVCICLIQFAIIYQ